MDSSLAGATPPGDSDRCSAPSAPMITRQGSPGAACCSTPKLQAEETLQETEARLREMMENAPIGIFRSTLDGRLLQANAALVRIFGYDSEADFLSHITWAEKQLYVKSAQRQELLKLVLAADRHVCSEVEVYRKDGVILTVNLSMRAVRGTSGEVQWLEGYVENITDRKRIEQLLWQSQKMEAIGTLAGGIAHDFNNILGAMICHAELARRAQPGDPQIREDLDEVLKACDRARDLVRQILAFSSHAQQGRKPARFAPILEEALKLLRASLPGTLEMQTHIEADLPLVLANSTQVNQVIVSLCDNAAHAMRGRPGRLEVRLEQYQVDGSNRAACSDLPEGCYLRLTVRDNGHGMTAETQRRMFEPFFTTKNPGEGSGLGLSVVHGIMRDHGGAIRVFSELDRGTEIQAFFPVLTITQPLEGRSGLMMRGPQAILSIL